MILTQSKLYSCIESVINVGLGFIVALVSQILIFPLFNIHIPFTDNLLIGLIFTVIGIIRSYIIRRLFNYYES
jgi:hypothetical protein